MTTLSAIRGMPDVFPKEAKKQDGLIQTSKTIAALYGFEEIKTPILESLDVFKRAVGTETDIVQKEMYTLKDRGERWICLRPEGTASVMRAVLEHKLTQSLPLKFFYSGPMFRYERPQAGRLRQFTQIGVEHLGDASPYADIECIALGHQILKTIGLNNIILTVNTLGDAVSRARFREALVAYYAQHKDALSADSLRRLESNPLRILDSKDPGDIALNQKAPSLMDFLTQESKDFFQAVLEGLQALEIPFVHNPHLVRGLDYYCHTAFEFMSTDLGAQATVLAGGRYDSLSTTMGGPAFPGIGFAAGIERLALLLPEAASIRKGVLVIPIGAEHLAQGLALTQTIRGAGMEAELNYQASLKSGLKRANKEDKQFALLLGEEEIKNQQVLLKDLTTGTQESLSFEDLVPYLRKHHAPS